MVTSRRRFAENLKEMHGIKKKHVKGVQNFCFSQLSMQILWRRHCSRVVDLKPLIIHQTRCFNSLVSLVFIWLIRFRRWNAYHLGRAHFPHLIEAYCDNFCINFCIKVVQYFSYVSINGCVTTWKMDV